MVGVTPQSPDDDMTVILPPLAKGTDPVAVGNIPLPPDDDMTVILPPLTWGEARDQVVVGAIPQQPPGFQPRTALLAELDLAQRGAPAVQVLAGRCGVGKTQLAAAYARAKLAAGWRLVAWINAGDTISLRAGLAAVADAARLGVQDSGRDAADLAQAVRRRLEADGVGCLLVFDDAKDPETLRPFIPAGGAAGVLITTTQPSVADLGTSVPVDVFSEKEALAVLARRTGLANQEVAAVAAEMGYLPLGLAHVAAAISAQHINSETYMERLRAVCTEKYLTQDEEQRPYPHGVAEAVLLSMEAVRADDPAGVRTGIMETMAVLSPARVRRELLHAAGRAGVLDRRRLRSRVSATLVDLALARLAEQSLLTLSLDGQTVVAHDLVGRVICERLARQGRLAAVCRAAASSLETRAGTLASSRDRVAVIEATEQITALRDNAARPGTEADDKLTRMLLSLQLWALHHVNELSDTMPQVIAARPLLVPDFEREVVPGHPGALGSQDSPASAQAALNATEAVGLFEQMLAAQERLAGAEHPDTLAAQNNLATAYWDAGRTADAILVFERTLAARERLLGPNHPRTLNSKGNLAIAYRAADRAAEAIPLFEQTLTGRERLLGAHHSATLASRSNLAHAYWDAGRVADAIPLVEQILVARERLLGPDHPGTVATRDSLVAAYKEAGRAE